jgi:SulP family sulfate permease
MPPFAAIKTDTLSGFTVALALVPEAIAFAFVAAVDPLVGLYAAFIVGLITAIFGGRPGMISGATGALAVVVTALVIEHGVEYLFATVILMGLLQSIAGICKLGKFIRMVPHPVMLGFVNGLAIVIFLSQLRQFGIDDAPGMFAGTFLANTPIDIHWLPQPALIMMLGLVALTMAIIVILPKFTKAIPASLVAIVTVSLLVIGFRLDTKVVGDIASIAGDLPQFKIPSVPLTWETLNIILPYAVIMAAIGLIESLLTLRLIDEVTETRGRGNRECVAQGLANTITGFFGGMGGCAMIGQSMVNINSGGRGRLSALVAALSLLAFILLLSNWIEKIPVAALVGVMFIVVIGTFEWSSFRIIDKIPRGDAFVLILVSVVTVATDLAFAVLVGVIVSALVFAWEHAKRIEVRRSQEGRSTKYTVRGAIFFGSTAGFVEKFSPKEDQNDVVIDFWRARVCDHSGIEAIDMLAERYINAGKNLHLLHLSDECKILFKRAGDLVEVNMLEDPKYFVADDALEQ